MNKLFLGMLLRCPHCGQGHISEGLLKTRDLCDVCHVRFDRKSGESAGASIIWISILPIVSMIFYFIVFSYTPDTPVWVHLIITLTFTIVVGLIGYRHARGIWVAVVELTDGLKTDAEAEATPS